MQKYIYIFKKKKKTILELEGRNPSGYSEVHQEGQLKKQLQIKHIPDKSKALKFLPAWSRDVLQSFHAEAPKNPDQGLAVFVCVSASIWASRSCVVSNLPTFLPSYPRSTSPCCHSTQAPRGLSFSIELTRAFPPRIFIHPKTSRFAYTDAPL